MSYTFDVRFSVPEQDVDRWKKVIAVLEGGIGGAKLQEATEWQGAAVAKELEAILDDPDLGAECFNLEESEVTGNQVFMMFECHNDDFAERLEVLLGLCRVANVDIDIS